MEFPDILYAMQVPVKLIRNNLAEARTRADYKKEGSQHATGTVDS
jgi:hypothetical protein